MFKRWKRWLATCGIVLAAVFAAALFDPIVRQLMFGPKYNGIPLIMWQTFFRDWDVADPAIARRSPSLLDNIHAAAVGEANPSAWEKLSVEDRRAILMTLADDPKEVVRMHVAAYLGDVPASPDVVDRLKRYADEKSPGVRKYTARSLGKLDTSADEVLPQIFTLLQDSDAEVCAAAQTAVSSVGSKAPGAVLPRLLPLIRSANLHTRLLALKAISEIQPPPRESIPVVLEELNDAEWQVRDAALTTLGFLKAKEAIPQIIAALSDPRREVRNSAAYAIRNIGPDAKAAIPDLLEQVKALAPEDAVYNVPALEALAAMGKEAQGAVPELLKLRSHRSELVRQEVEKTLSKIDAVQFPPKPK